MKKTLSILFAIVCSLTIPGVLVLAQDSEPEAAGAADLAKKLSNPLASLISFPIQFNYDENIGSADDGSVLKMTVQPVIPISISEDWSMISRTILPVMQQEDIFPGAGDQSGLGDTTQSLFFSPKAPTENGVIWGVGPIITLPTATDDFLGSRKWTLGPTVVMLKMSGQWTKGILASHSWSVTGSDNAADVSATFVQPFLSYVTPTAWTYGINLEATRNQKTDEWSVPVNLTVFKMLKLGKKQLASVGGGFRYWLDSAESGPEGWGLRFQITLLFPK